MPEYLKKINRSSVVQRVIDRLTQAMLSGELKPGDKIPTEMELSEQLGVARNSIREAIKILVYIGVLEIKRAEGTFVCNGFSESLIDPMIYGIILNQQNEQELHELRAMVETGVMRLAVEKCSEEEIAPSGIVKEEIFLLTPIFLCRVSMERGIVAFEVAVVNAKLITGKNFLIKRIGLSRVNKNNKI